MSKIYCPEVPKERHISLVTLSKGFLVGVFEENIAINVVLYPKSLISENHV